MPVASDVRAAYERDGFVMLRGLYTASQMAEWKAKTREITHAADVDSGVEVWFLPKFPPYFLAQFTGPALVEPIKAILGPAVEFLSAKPVVKTGKIRFASPWHQDYPYWLGTNKLSAWIAMDPATRENGCLKVVRGGHTRYLPHHPPADGSAFANRLEEHELPPGEIVDCVMAPGDAILFHDLLPHSSHPNPEGRDRWAMIPTYRSAATPDSSTVWQHALRV
jgi:hypothetical protein